MVAIGFPRVGAASRNFVIAWGASMRPSAYDSRPTDPATISCRTDRSVIARAERTRFCFRRTLRPWTAASFVPLSRRRAGHRRAQPRAARALRICPPAPSDAEADLVLELFEE